MHDLRHSFASAAISAGMTLAQIGELLGHQTPTTTHRYAHLMEEAANAAANATADVIMARMKKVPA
jgi:site-specific recombinase XerD